MSQTASPSGTGTTNTNPLLRALLGLLLLLPACGLCSINLIPLTIETFTSGLQKISFSGDGEFVGMENFERLVGYLSFSSVLEFSFSMIVVHFLAVAVIPLLLAFLVNTLGKKLSLGVRLFFTLPLTFFGPALMMYSPFYLRSLWETDSPESPYLLIVGLMGLAVACAVGLIVYSAILRGRKDSEAGGKSALPAFIITWLVMQLATTAYVVQSYNSLSGFVATVPASFLISRASLLELGEIFAFSTLILLFVALLGFAATLLIVLGRVQLKLETQDETTAPPSRGTITTLGWVALAIGGIAVFLAAVLPWFLAIVKSITSLEEGLSGFSIARIWINSLLPPLLIILFLQLPVAYFSALGIGVVRPFGRHSRWLLLPFSPWLFVTSLPVAFAAFINLRNAELLDSILILMPPLLLNVPILFILTLFFMGQEPKWREARAEGATAMNALFKKLIIPSLPLAGFIAALTLLAAAQELVMTNFLGSRSEQFTAAHAIYMLTLIGSGGSTALVIILFGLPISLIFFAIFAALQAKYLNRLVLTFEQAVTEQIKEEPEPVTS